LFVIEIISLFYIEFDGARYRCLLKMKLLFYLYLLLLRFHNLFKVKVKTADLSLFVKDSDLALVGFIAQDVKGEGVRFPAWRAVFLIRGDPCFQYLFTDLHPDLALHGAKRPCLASNEGIIEHDGNDFSGSLCEVCLDLNPPNEGVVLVQINFCLFVVLLFDLIIEILDPNT
jgi:hypothetical protein